MQPSTGSRWHTASTRTLWTVAAVLTSVALLNGCESGDDCGPYGCDCGFDFTLEGEQVFGPAVGSEPPTCVFAAWCNADRDCPPSPDGSVAPVCRAFGDHSKNGFRGSCVLPCTQSCPDEMTCLSGRCSFALDPAECPTHLDCRGAEDAGQRDEPADF